MCEENSDEAKRFMKDKFTAWYSNEVKQQIESGGDTRGGGGLPYETDGDARRKF